MGTVNVGKVICCFEETLFTAGVTVLLRREIHFWTYSKCQRDAVWKVVCWNKTGHNCIIEIL
jgi:hypothetical protein